MDETSSHPDKSTLGKQIQPSDDQLLAASLRLRANINEVISALPAREAETLGNALATVHSESLQKAVQRSFRENLNARLVAKNIGRGIASEVLVSPFGLNSTPLAFLATTTAGCIIDFGTPVGRHILQSLSAAVGAAADRFDAEREARLELMSRLEDLHRSEVQARVSAMSLDERARYEAEQRDLRTASATIRRDSLRGNHHSSKILL